MTFVTVTTYGCAEYLCHIGLLPGRLEYHRQRIGIDEIQRAVAARFHIPLFEMTSARRAREVARPRQIAMYLCRELTPRSLPQIGRHFGKRDHTTVMHACRQIERLSLIDPDMATSVREITAELRA